MVGLEVTPVRPSSRRRASSPEVISWRRMLSSQSDWPICLSSLIGLTFLVGRPARARLVSVAIVLPRRQELGGRGNDVPRRGAGGVHALIRLARCGETLHGKMGDLGRKAVRGKGFHHGRPQTA